MLNFTVGPVMSSSFVLDIASKDSPYFRTPEFSEVMLESERAMLTLLHAPEKARCVFLTASGTGAMEAAVMGVLRPAEEALVVNGGSFGQRFVDLCRLHGHEAREVALGFGCQVRRRELEDAITPQTGALLVNMGETSSGILYDMPMIAEFCAERDLLLVVDAISTFIADELDMAALGADVVITGSQKALACHPGVSVIALSERAVRRVDDNPEQCLYLSLKEALKNGKRGQTPWTPAVTTLLELHERLGSIVTQGIGVERAEIAARAARVRECLANTSLELVAENPSNAVSAYRCPRFNARDVIEMAKERYGMWLCPNGGAFADEVFRIGHIGNICQPDMDALCVALLEMSDEGLF